MVLLTLRIVTLKSVAVLTDKNTIIVNRVIPNSKRYHPIFLEAYLVFIGKIHYLFALFLCIANRVISSAAFVLDTAYYKV